MDIGSAFTYVFDDESWITKLAIGGGIILFGIVLSPVLIGLILLFVIPTGYMVAVLKNVRDKQPIPLPEWSEFGTLIKAGFSYIGIWIIYHLPALVFSCAAISTQFLPQVVDFSGNTETALGFFTICFNIFNVLFSLAGTIVFPAALIRYAESDNFMSALQFGEVFDFIRDHIGDYIIAIILGIVATLISYFGIFLCGIGILFTYFWSILVKANLYGQLARKVQGAAL